MTALFLAFVINLLDNPRGAQRNIFAFGMDDYLADFLNLLRYVAERDPYFNIINGVEQKIYLPLIYLIVYPFSKLDNFAEMSSLQEAWNSKLGNFSAFSFMGFCIFLLMYSLNVIRKKYNLSPFILTGIIFSNVFIYSIERANIAFLTSACVGLFIAFYNSKSSKEKLIAIIALAVAATLKIYPVLFGCLYFEKRQFREIFLSALLTVFLIFAPFLFFKRGFNNIPQLIENIRLNKGYSNFKISSGYSFTHLIYYLLTKLNISSGKVDFFSNISYIILFIVSILSIIISAFVKNKWLTIALLTMTVLFIPVTVSRWYCGLYMFPLIIIFFGTVEERSTVFNIFSLIVFIIWLSPFQLRAISNHFIIGSNRYISNIFFLIFFLVVFIISFKQSIKILYKNNE